MNRQTLIGLIVSATISVIGVTTSYMQMSAGGRYWRRYGETAYILAGFELLVGLILVVFPRGRYYGAGVLCGGLLTLLVGYSVCSGVNLKP